MANRVTTEIDWLVKDLREAAPPTRHRARHHLRTLCWEAGAKGGEDERRRLAESLAAQLAEAQSYYAAQALCEMLGLIGNVDSVPALAALLESKETRDPALSAISQIEGAQASAAIIKAAKSDADAEFRVSAINKLSDRDGDEAKAALVAMLEEPQAEIRLAAAEGLASFADVTLDEKIAAAAPHASPRDANRVARARLRLGAELMRAGKRKKAREIFEAVGAQADVPEAQQEAAKNLLKQVKD